MILLHRSGECGLTVKPHRIPISMVFLFKILVKDYFSQIMNYGSKTAMLQPIQWHWSLFLVQKHSFIASKFMYSNSYDAYWHGRSRRNESHRQIQSHISALIRWHDTRATVTLQEIR